MSRAVAILFWAALFACLSAAGQAFATELNDRLWITASNGDLEGVKAALEDGADVDYATPDKDGRMAVLHVAAMQGNADVVSLLLRRGANVNIVERDGRTPLLTAVSFNNKDVAEALIANGADVRRANSAGPT